MANSPKTTSWIWSAGMGVNGVRIDLEKAQLEWYDDLACACDDSTAEQSYTDFCEKGPAFGNPPDDVLQEIQTVVAQLISNPIHG